MGLNPFRLEHYSGFFLLHFIVIIIILNVNFNINYYYYHYSDF